MLRRSSGWAAAMGILSALGTVVGLSAQDVAPSIDCPLDNGDANRDRDFGVAITYHQTVE